MKNKLLEKTIVLGMIILFMGASVTPGIGDSQTVFGKTIYVDDDSECPGDGTQEWPYCKIQYAIDNASNGDIVFVYNGTYSENLVVDVKLELIGLSKDLLDNDTGGAIIDGGDSGDVVRIATSSVQISGFTIQNSSNSNAGVRIESTSNIIFNNIVIHNGYGIICSYDNNDFYENKIIDNSKDGVFLSSLNSISINGNNITRNGEAGLKLESSNDIAIWDNNITGNQGDGISLEESSVNNIFDNFIFENKGDGIEFYHYSSNNSIYDNTISNNSLYGVKISWSSQKNNFNINRIMNNTYDGMYIDHTHSITEAKIHIENNYIVNNSGCGLYIINSRENTIILNKINGNGNDGIYLHCSNYSTISDNIIKNNDDGIYQLSSKGNTFSSNIIINCTKGICMEFSTGNTITSNINISNNDIGIHLYSQSNSNTISYNTISNNTFCGIKTYSSENNQISDNHITKNEIGIQLTPQSDDNTISKNNIINNTVYGIQLTYSKGNQIFENDVEYNNDTGVFIEVSSNNNKIYHNNFINNTNQAYDECENTWDNGYPSGGNHWNDYDEESEKAYDNMSGPNQDQPDSDGIADNPYNISGGDNQDRYPFMNPYGWLTIPDIGCEGVLNWTKIKPDDTVTGSFSIRNIGDPDSLLDWNITEWPSWGTWTFTPNEGDDLTPEDGSLTVQVSVVAPNEKNKQFSGNIMITNRYDSNDYCTISVSLATPKNKAINVNPFFLRFLECYPSMFPLLRHLLGL